MASEPSVPTCQAERAGTVLCLARAAGARLFFSGLRYCLAATPLLALGLVTGYLSLAEDMLPLLALAGPCTLLGALFAATAVRRFRAMGDENIYLRAGPGGIVIGMPARGGGTILRLKYRYTVHEMTWAEVRDWHPYVMRVNGIPTDRSLIFIGTEGWKLDVPAVFFAGAQEELAGAISQAIRRTDLGASGSPEPVTVGAQ